MVLIVEIPAEVYEILVDLAATQNLTVAEWVPVHLARRAAAWHGACGQLVTDGVLKPGDARTWEGRNDGHA